MAIDDIKLKIIQAVFSLEVKRGHLKWSITQIAESVGISRSLVYYHFGKTKMDILLGCLDLIGQEFYGLTSQRQEIAKVSLADSLELSHSMYKQNVAYAIFYQKWRNQPSLIRDKYLEFEKLYDDKLKKQFPRATLAQRAALQGFFHGLVTAPFLDRKALDAAVDLLKLKELSA